MREQHKLALARSNRCCSRMNAVFPGLRTSRLRNMPFSFSHGPFSPAGICLPWLRTNLYFASGFFLLFFVGLGGKKWFLVNYRERNKRQPGIGGGTADGIGEGAGNIRRAGAAFVSEACLFERVSASLHASEAGFSSPRPSERFPSSEPAVRRPSPGTRRPFFHSQKFPHKPQQTAKKVCNP